MPARRSMKEATCMNTVPTNINNYLRQFAYQLEERILQQFPPLHQPGEPLPAELARLRRTPTPRRLSPSQESPNVGRPNTPPAQSPNAVLEKRFISLGAMFVHSGG